LEEFQALVAVLGFADAPEVRKQGEIIDSLVRHRNGLVADARS